MTRHWRYGAVAAAVLTGAGCSQPPPVVQLSAPVNHVVETFVNVSPTAHISVGAMLICLSGPGSANILKVEADRPVGNIHVSDFKVRPNPLIAKPKGDMLGDFRGTLTQAGFEGNRVLDSQCQAPESGAGEELGVDFTTRDGAGGGARGWKITYESGGRSETFTFPLTVVACPKASQADAACTTLTSQLDPKKDS